MNHRNKIGLELISSVIALFLIAFCFFATNVKADNDQSYAIQNSKLPIEDMSETTRCYMEENEIQEDYENEKIEAALMSRSTAVDDCVVTYYCPCSKCCGKSDGITATGVQAIAGATVAVDPDIIPLGSDVRIGDNWYVATDTGPNGNHVDVFVNDHQEALNLGMKRETVWWCLNE